MSTRYGEMLDMIACLSIYNGGAEEKDRMSFDEFCSKAAEEIASKGL